MLSAAKATMSGVIGVLQSTRTLGSAQSEVRIVNGVLQQGYIDAQCCKGNNGVK